MLSPIQKPNLKKRRTSVNVLRNLISADTYFEFQTTFPLKRCIECLERDAKISADRSYGPFVDTPKSLAIRPDIAMFTLPVKFGERQKSEGLVISGSLEGLNDGSTMIRGKVTNDYWGLQMLWIAIMVLFYICTLQDLAESLLWLFPGLVIVIATFAFNSSTKRKGLQYIEALLSPL